MAKPFRPEELRQTIVDLTSVQRRSEIGQGFTILITDDEPVVMNVLRQALVREGYSVLEASTAEEAFHLAEAHSGPIHLLITDHLLQNYRGRDVAEQIKRTQPSMRVMPSQDIR